MAGRQIKIKDGFYLIGFVVFAFCCAIVPYNFMAFYFFFLGFWIFFSPVLIIN
jgi:hypothetical protein